MPDFDLNAHTDAPVEEVWKLLHDPSRFPEWWEGIETVQASEGSDYTMWPEGWPDFPMEQHIEASSSQTAVTISCLVSDLIFTWELRERGDGTDVRVHVELPEKEAHRLDTQRACITHSLGNLSRLAAGVA